QVKYQAAVETENKLASLVLDTRPKPELRKYQAQVEADMNLADERIGPKGLHLRIAEEKEKNSRLDEEQKDLVDRQTNSLVDTELLRARTAQLKRRVAELEKARDDK